MGVAGHRARKPPLAGRGAAARPGRVGPGTSGREAGAGSAVPRPGSFRVSPGRPARAPRRSLSPAVSAARGRQGCRPAVVTLSSGAEARAGRGLYLRSRTASPFVHARPGSREPQPRHCRPAPRGSRGLRDSTSFLYDRKTLPGAPMLFTKTRHRVASSVCFFPIS